MTIPPQADPSRRRTGAVHEMPDARGDRLRSGRPDPDADYALTPPCECRRSDEVELDFAT
ncbi:hypothetical protein Dvina_36980 [Dactylosporangium vinaceum]|uniref:Uncharacterized protein n=1 Tax=Dactylosporangium vinaceum TaxID=53362 RepID=A0ABV5MIS8_9ACTN|nr:hypothetical protein [Dactylosporangium vinaceum]UAB93767.1 hypothetical protein Dvina_36980 [Dactylosporangium vinaceum]